VGAEHLGLVPADLGVPVVVLGAAYEQWLAVADDTDPAAPVSSEDVVLQLYSSGTTGRPKGAMITSANLALTARMAATAWRMGPDSVNLVASPLFHIGGAGYGLTTLSQGGHTVLVREAAAAVLLAEVQRHRVTHAFWVPAVVQSVLDAPDVEQADLSSLQLVGYGGAPMTEALLTRAIDRLGCGFLGVYGMTETSGTVLVLPAQDHDPGGPRAHLLRSVGRPLPWVEMSIRDPLTGEPAPDGAVGEIWVRSGQNMAGYWDQPAVTADTLVEDGWLRTGDAAHLDPEGFVFLHDRLKDMIISGGENVYPAEVENALAAHPAVADVAVIAIPHARWGETVKAVVVLRPGASLSLDEVVAFTRERLARYKCPTSLDIVDALPRNASGKVLKKDLRAAYRLAGAR
jgi:long-chain acyl-CoA synthetase